MAVKVVSAPGELIGTCRQLIPPSSESSAIGTVPAGVVARPTATTRFPLMATCCRTADEASAGAGRTIVVRGGPLAGTQTRGGPSCDPTDTKPAAPAATASTWLEPVTSFTSCARIHDFRSGDHHTSATQAPPVATSLPTMT